jgi:single stranded DNA-binding protein
MPKSVNQVILVGNVGKDPEVRYSQSGTPIANFSLAPNERFKDRNDEWQERTEWHNIVAWQRLAEIVGEYVAKRLQTLRRGKDSDVELGDRQSGERKYRTEIAPTTCCRSARGKTAAATTNVRSTTRIRTSLPTLAPAKLWTGIFHSEMFGRFLHIVTKGELS